MGMCDGYLLDISGFCLGGFIAVVARGNPGVSGLSPAYPTTSNITPYTPTAPYLQACQFLFFVFFILGYKVRVSLSPPLPDSPTLSTLFSTRIEPQSERAHLL